MPLTIGQKLDTCVARRVHVSDIMDPMVRALWWKRWEWRNAEIIDDCDGAADYGHLIESAEREVEIARKARAKIIRNLWSTRCLDRLVSTYVPARALADAVELERMA